MQSHQERGRWIEMGNPPQTGNNTPLLFGYQRPPAPMDIDIPPDKRIPYIHANTILLPWPRRGCSPFPPLCPNAAECFGHGFNKAKGQENPLAPAFMVWRKYLHLQPRHRTVH